MVAGRSHGAAVTRSGVPRRSEDAITLVLARGDEVEAAFVQTTRSLVARFGQGVIVAADRPSGLLHAALRAAGIDADGVHFIDCVSSFNGVPPVSSPRVLHLESPALLEKIALRVDHVLRRLQGPKFVVVDSLSSLCLYNDEGMVSEFTHALVNRLRMQHVHAALLLVDRPGSALQDILRPMVDAVAAP